MYIYKITNIVNNKIYIGQTVDFKRRVQQHILWANKMYKEYPLYLAMNEFGVDNFKFEVLEECEDSFADELEKSLIQKLDSYNSDIGYNLNIGDIGEKFNDSTKRKMSETQLGEKNHQYNMRGHKSVSSKPLLCITTGESFESVMLASEYFNIGFSCIARVCRGERKSIHGLEFKYIEKPKYISHKKIKNKTKVIHETYDIINNKFFSSYHEACREYDIDYCTTSSNIKAHGFYYDLKNNACLVFKGNKDSDYKEVMSKKKNSMSVTLDGECRYYFAMSDVFRKVFNIDKETQMIDCESDYRKFVKNLKKNKSIRENGYEIVMLTVIA